MQIEPGFTARKMTIASVYPIACDAWRDYGHTQAGGNHRFVLEAAPKDGYTTLTISDMWQRVQDVEVTGASGRQTLKAFWVTVESLADDLYAHWAVHRIGTGGGFRPGIKIIAGDTPTEAELEEMRASQRGYFEGLWHEAVGMAAKHQWKFITDTHRAAARWLGLDAPWVANIGTSQDWKHCTACYEKIDARASVCKVCRSPQEAEAPVAVVAEKPRRMPIPPPISAPRQPVTA
jgi:hypothetical protein